MHMNCCIHIVHFFIKQVSIKKSLASVYMYGEGQWTLIGGASLPSLICSSRPLCTYRPCRTTAILGIFYHAALVPDNIRLHHYRGTCAIRQTRGETHRQRKWPALGTWHGSETTRHSEPHGDHQPERSSIVLGVQPAPLPIPVVV